jgi:hypothetical protein
MQTVIRCSYSGPDISTVKKCSNHGTDNDSVTFTYPSVRHPARTLKGGSDRLRPLTTPGTDRRSREPPGPQTIMPSLRDASGTLDRPFLLPRSALARVKGTKSRCQTQNPPREGESSGPYRAGREDGQVRRAP